jgi:pimeloyl-ACP methyl ester carboxylesterase
VLVNDEPVVPEPFTPTLDAAVVEDLKERLERSRFPGRLPLDDWPAGTPISFARELTQQWLNDYDFERYQAAVGSLPHHRVELGGDRTHFLHARSPHPHARPIIITHGWPSSFLEIVPLLDHLTRPEDHGGRAEDAFHVVVPSMPGFAYSDTPDSLDRMTAASIADRWRTLMSALGYDSFFASGADVGARVTAWLAVRHPDAVLGAHMDTNAVSPTYTPGVHDGPLTPEEEAWLRLMEAWEATEGAYHHLQATKPLTAALALADSPVALAAWVAEKWQAWSSVDFTSEPGRTALLDLLTLYWTTNSFPSSVLHYYAHDLPPGPRPMLTPDAAPVSLYASESEIGGVPPESLARRQYHQPRWTVLPRGGHFMAFEEPDLLAADIRDFAAISR